MADIVTSAYDKLYGNLSEKRKEDIDKIVNALKSDYFTGDVKSLDALAKAKGITVIDTDKIMGFWRLRKEKQGAENKAYIVRRKGAFQEVTRYATAHELGHELLNHDQEPDEIKEEQAHYFAEKLTGLNFFNWYLLEKLNFIIDIFRKTPLMLRAFCSDKKEILRRDQDIVEELVEANP